jgi:hypothetical protein
MQQVKKRLSFVHFDLSACITRKLERRRWSSDVLFHDSTKAGVALACKLLMF